jgi:hypothetical protein
MSRRTGHSRALAADADEKSRDSHDAPVHPEEHAQLDARHAPLNPQSPSSAHADARKSNTLNNNNKLGKIEGILV